MQLRNYTKSLRFPRQERPPLTMQLSRIPDHELMENFGRRLVELRKGRRLTQSQLSDLLDVQPPVISRWENGVSKPQFDYVVKLAEVLEVTFDDLLGDTEADSANPKFEIRNRRLQDLCRQVDQLDLHDQEVVCHIMDSLVRKERVRAVMNDSTLR